MSEDRFRLRLDLIDGPELRCPHCGEWWPITTEFWEKNEWHLCLTCKRERARLYQRLRLKDPAFRASEIGRVRRYRAWLRENCPQYLGAYERERKARARQKVREYRAAQREKISA